MTFCTPRVIACAPNGAYKQRSDHSALPLTTSQIVRTAIAVRNAGASMLHLHIREDNGDHSLDPRLYLHTLDAIKTELGNSLLLQITSEAGGKYQAEQQIANVMAVNPDAVSVALREIIHSPEDHPRAQVFFHWIAAHEVLPQYILYSAEDVELYNQLRSSKIMPAHPHSVLFVLGRYHHAQQSSCADLSPFIESWSAADIAWMVCAFGATEQDCLLHSAKLGGHARMGFENNLYQSSGEIADSNEAQIQGLKTALIAQNATIATALEAREILSSKT